LQAVGVLVKQLLLVAQLCDDLQVRLDQLECIASAAVLQTAAVALELLLGHVEVTGAQVLYMVDYGVLLKR